MKKSNLLLAVVFTFIGINFIAAQGFQGQATYMTKRSLSDVSIGNSSKTSKSDGISDEMNKQMQEQIKKAFEKTYILDFNTFESSYLQEVALQAPEGKSNGFSMSVSFSGDNTALYKNIKTKQYLQEMENYKGKTNLITDNLPVYDWKIEGETKKIGGYDCYKATTIIKVTTKETENYQAQKLKESKRKTVLYPAKEPKDKLIEAWFTNAIPVGHGPEKFWGLPGLILELTDGKTTYLCSKIILNPKDKKPIPVPSKGKVISQEDFAAAQKIYFDKMADENGMIIHSTTTKD